MMKLLSLSFKIITSVSMMFLNGEKIKNIKSYSLIEYGHYLHDNKNFDAALKLYNRAISLDSNNFYAYWAITTILIEKKMFSQALDSCNKGLLIKSDVSLYILKCIICKTLRDSTQTKEVLQNTLKYFNDRLDVLYDTLAHKCYNFNMLEAAEQYAIDALAINPSEAAIHYNLGKIYSKQQQYQMAKGEFQKVLQLSSEDQKRLKRYKSYAQNEIQKLETSNLNH